MRKPFFRRKINSRSVKNGEQGWISRLWIWGNAHTWINNVITIIIAISGLYLAYSSQKNTSATTEPQPSQKILPPIQSPSDSEIKITIPESPQPISDHKIVSEAESQIPTPTQQSQPETQKNSVVCDVESPPINCLWRELK